MRDQKGKRGEPSTALLILMHHAEVPAGPLVTEPNPWSFQVGNGSFLPCVHAETNNTNEKTWHKQVRNANPSISAICLRSVRISCCKKLSWSFGSIKCQQPRAIKAQGKGSKTSCQRMGGESQDWFTILLLSSSGNFMKVLKHPETSSKHDLFLFPRHPKEMLSKWFSGRTH